MKITPELLKKYARGECTEEERLLIEHWMPGTGDINRDFLDKELKESHKEMWLNIAPELEPQKTPGPAGKGRSVSFYRRIFQFGVAACLLMAVFIGGYYNGQYQYDQNSTQALQKSGWPPGNGVLYAVSKAGVEKKIIENKSEFVLEGTLRLHNDSSIEKIITCNGKVFKLRPHATSLLMSMPNKDIQLMESNQVNAFLYYIPSVHTTFKICV